MKSRVQEVRFPAGKLALDAVRQDCTPWFEPDPDWRFTDAEGHVHRWGAQTFCVEYGPQYYDEDGEAFRDSWYACKACGERIKPGFRVPRKRQFIETGREWYGSFVSADIGECGEQVQLPPIFHGYSGQIILTRCDRDLASGLCWYEFVGQGELIQSQLPDENR